MPASPAKITSQNKVGGKQPLGKQKKTSLAVDTSRGATSKKMVNVSHLDSASPDGPSGIKLEAF